MDIIHAIVLGIVQGITEFLPISSDGHLNLVPFALGWPTPTLAFTVAAHLGTLIAVTVLLRDRVLMLVRTVLSWKTAPAEDRALTRLVAISTVPAVVVGLTLRGVVESSVERPVLVALLLGLNGYLMLRAENTVVEEGPARQTEDLETRDAWLIGAAQATALLPGISRSGMTLAMSLQRRIDRTAAVRFSFLMAIPVIAGAVVFEIPAMLSEGALGSQAVPFLIAIITAGLSGYVAARWLIRKIADRGLRPFGLYCIFAAIASLVVALARG
jgi:undecaprenyl-diphosphatase